QFRTLYQLIFALAIVLALIIQFVNGVIATGALTLSYVGLFISYFTILSNILVAVVLCAEAYADSRGTEVSPRFNALRGLATFCIIATGITYTFFLRGPAAEGVLQNSIPWINDIFHHVMPIVMTFDWVAFPVRTPVKWRSILGWIGFSAVY